MTKPPIRIDGDLSFHSFQILLSQRQTAARHHNGNDRAAIGAGIQSIRKLRDTSRQISHCRHRVSSAIVLESAIVHVYAIN